MDIKGKNIIITGGSLGIGKETTNQLLDKGANVLVTGRSMERLRNSFSSSKANLLLFDIGDIDNINFKADQCISILENKVDILINNAGIGVSKPLEDVNYNDFLEVFNVNVFGLSLFTKKIIPLMKKQKNGTIINIGSTASLRGYNNGSVYASSKFALRCLTQCWQSELRPYNIRVCQVNPSEVTTAFGKHDRKEREDRNNLLGPGEIAHTIISVLEMENKGFIPEVNIWATNPF